MSVVSEDTIDGSAVFHVISETHSGSFLDNFYKVRDKIESWADKENLFSRKYKKSILEGRYRKEYSALFSYEDSLAYSPLDTIPIKKPIHDALSIFYYFRAESLWVGKIIKLNNFDNNKLKTYSVIVERKKKVQVPAGKFNCFVLKPYAEKGELFKYKGQVKFYISDDSLRLPVQVESEATMGAMILKLESYSIKK